MFLETSKKINTYNMIIAVEKDYYSPTVALLTTEPAVLLQVTETSCHSEQSLCWNYQKMDILICSKLIVKLSN